MRIYFALTVLLCIVTPSVALDDYSRATQLDALRYRIHLTLNDSDNTISGEAEILFAVTQDSVAEVPLDFEGLTVDEVKENSRPGRFNSASGRLTITLKGTYHKGDQFTVAIRYHGAPRDGLFIKKNKFGDRTVFADNWPNRAHYWFPAIDHPYDKAEVEFFVTAPDRYGVVANGELLEITSLQNGSKVWHWREAAPIPVYCMVAGAAEFSILKSGSSENVPIFLYLYPKDRDHGIKDFRRAAQMLEFYTNLIGPYPYEKLALVESSTRFGGMENSSNIFFDEKTVDGTGKIEGTVAHEIAHQWFGDAVTESDWHHLWLSEGFATYFGHLFFERADGRDKFLSLMRTDREIVLSSSRANPRPIHDTSIKDLFQLLNRNNYQKGGWVLHMLRHLLGDEKFFAGVREYYRSHRGGNALTEDFEHAMERQYGSSLGWFFKQWIYEPGYPVYDVLWRWDQANRQLLITVTQKQQGPLFRMPVDVEFILASGVRKEVIDVNQREQVFTFKVDSRPASIALDPGEWVLKEYSIREER
jgi:aminopeptidase N